MNTHIPADGIIKGMMGLSRDENRRFIWSASDDIVDALAVHLDIPYDKSAREKTGEILDAVASA